MVPLLYQEGKKERKTTIMAHPSCSRTVRCSKTDATCSVYGHQWETTIAAGLLACRRCYLTATCPVCIAVFPDSHCRLVLCPQHRVADSIPDLEEGREARIMREQIVQASPIPRRATATQSYAPANPHRTGHRSGLHPEDQPSQSSELEEDDRYYQVRTSSSARRYQTTEGNPVIEQGNRRLVIHREPLPQPAKKKTHWVLFLGIGMLVMMLLWSGLTELSSWWTAHQLDSTYGYPRTFQTDERVGFGDSQTPTHFIALNLNGQTEVIVCPASDCRKAVVYLGPRLFGDGVASVPVTLSFQPGIHAGSLDMVVHVGNQQVLFLNDGTQFKLQ